MIYRVLRVKDDDDNDVSAGDADDDVLRKSPRTNFEKGVFNLESPLVGLYALQLCLVEFRFREPFAHPPSLQAEASRTSYA